MSRDRREIGVCASAAYAALRGSQSVQIRIQIQISINLDQSPAREISLTTTDSGSILPRGKSVHLGDAKTVGETRRAGKRRIVVSNRLFGMKRVGAGSRRA